MSAEQGECDPARAKIHDRAVGRWENDSGTPAVAHQDFQYLPAGETGTVEDDHLRVRLIALENVVVALLAGAPQSQSELVREMATHISPRSGKTPHRMTIEAAHHMLGLADRAARYQDDHA